MAFSREPSDKSTISAHICTYLFVLFFGGEVRCLKDEDTGSNPVDVFFLFCFLFLFLY